MTEQVQDLDVESVARRLQSWHYLQGPGSGPKPYLPLAWEELTEEQRAHYRRGAEYVLGMEIRS